MAWELLRTDYVDATFEGLRRYLVSENGDGSVSFHDITNYTVKEGSFFGAKDANTINTAVNAILAALENGTDLYEVFTQFFELQKTLFLEESDAKQEGFEIYITQLRSYMDSKWDELKAEYTGDIQYFKDVQENAFNVWFQMVRDQLTNDVAGHLQTQIGNLNKLETENKDDLVSAINSICLSYDETMEILKGKDPSIIVVSLSAEDGADVEEKDIILYNVATGEETVMQYSGDSIRFEVLGDTEYSLTVEDMEEYITPDLVKITVPAMETLELNLVYKIKPLNDLTWPHIISIAENGRAGGLFSLHDTKEIELTTGEKVVVEIVGFDHDVLTSDESRKAGITFGMKDSLDRNYPMVYPITKAVGWKESDMRKVHIREHFYDVLPEDLKVGIKQVNKKTTIGDKSTVIETTADDVWLFSGSELGAEDDFVPKGEGSLYPAFTGVNDLKKPKGYWWTRSPNLVFNDYFVLMHTTGSIMGLKADAVNGIVAGFCV